MTCLRFPLMLTLTGALISVGLAPAQPPASGIPSISVRPPEQLRFRTTALNNLGWRLGTRSDAFGTATFREAAIKADAATLPTLEGVSTNLDYNLSPTDVAKVKTTLEELRLRMPAYRVASLPADEATRRRILLFAKSLGADMVITPAESGALAELDKLANETGMNISVVTAKPAALMPALAAQSKRLGLHVNTASTSLANLTLLKDRVFSVSIAPGTKNLAQFLTQLSRVQPTNIQPNWPPTTDGGAKKSDLKPLFIALQPTPGKDPVADLTTAAAAYDNDVRPAIAWRIDTLSRLSTISTPGNLAPEIRQKIDAAIPRQALAHPQKIRKLLVMDLCVNGGYYHATIPQGNLAVELIGKYTGAYSTVFSNDINNLRYPAIKHFDAVFLNNVEGEIFIDPAVMSGLLRYVREGGGVGGLHAATWASVDVPEFGELMGSQTGAHKYNGEPGTIRVEVPGTPLTAHFASPSFDVIDEFYHFLPDGPYSRDKLRVLISLDPKKTTLSGNQYTTRPDNDYGMVWIRSLGKGRVFNCALGHRPDFYQNPEMEKLLLGGIQFILGDLAADTTPSAKLLQSQ